MSVRYHRYRRSLTKRAQNLRRDPSPAERKLWYELLRDLPQRFTRQKPIGRFVVDFYCQSRALVIEVDGDSHYDDEARRYDASRTAALEALGLRVLRFGNDDVTQRFEGMREAILRALDPAP